MPGQLKRFVNAWRRGGIRLVARVSADRLADALLEFRYGSRTGGLVPIEALIDQWDDCHDYFPTSIRAFDHVIGDLAVGPDDVFVDYGCGMGRVLVLAARYPFRSIVGVDVSDELIRIARENVGRAVRQGDQAKIQLVHLSAQNFHLPDDASILYFYNPFHGAVLRGVFSEIERSLRARPRRLRIVYNNPSHFRQIESQYGWLTRHREYSFEYPIVVYEAIGCSAADGR